MIVPASSSSVLRSTITVAVVLRVVASTMPSGSVVVVDDLVVLSDQQTGLKSHVKPFPLVPDVVRPLARTEQVANSTDDS